MNTVDDHELFSRMKRELFSAVLGDILDTLGFLHQFLPQRIQPLQANMLYRYALWGELMSTRALRLGAAGVVLDGYSRDTNGIL